MTDDMETLLGGHLTRRQRYELQRRGILTRPVLKRLREAGAKHGLPAMHKMFHELIAERPLPADLDDPFNVEDMYAGRF